jgi:Domain of unknown function (DUF4411)
MAFLLDSNVFIEGWKRHYAPDICPGFWDWIAKQESAGTILSIERVREEILRREDPLAEWVTSRSRAFFASVDGGVLPHLATLAQWAQAQQYRPDAVAEFLDSADYYLIATAMASNHTVVTHERPSDGRRKVKIPEPCIAHNIPYVDPFVMLRRLGARFVLLAP